MKKLQVKEMTHKRQHYHSLSPNCFQPKGWIEEFCRRDADGITGNLNLLCEECSSEIFFTKKVPNEHDGSWASWWNGESEGNWAEAFIRLSYLLTDKKLMAKAKAYLDHMAASQEADGYLGIYQPEHRFSFACSRTGEFWTQSRVLLILLAGYKATGENRYLEVADSLANRILSASKLSGSPISFYDVPEKDGSKSHGLMIIEPLLMLHDLTGRQDVIEFCEDLYIAYSTHESDFPGEDCRLPNLLDPAVPFVGHGPHTCEQLRIPLLLYNATGKEIYSQAFQNGIRKLRDNLTLSGSCKSDEFIGVHPLDISMDEVSFENLSASLPLPTAGYEYCATTELANTFLAALAITGDPQYADMQEWLVFNAAMAARNPDGKSIQYLTADNLFAATLKVGERWDYSPTHTDAAVCCAPNSGKVIPTHLLHSWMRDTEDNALVAMLYGPCELRIVEGNQPITITESTNYPFENIVRFKISVIDSIRLTIKFRVPRWASQSKLIINNEEYQTEIETVNESGFLVVDRQWQNGDEITLYMEWQPEIQFAVDHSAAISYGPLLYCLRIPEQSSHTFTYPLNGFYDTDYTPAMNFNWDYTLQLEKDGSPGKNISLFKRPIHEGEYVWEYPPVCLRATMLTQAAQPEIVSLVPIGSTILRRTTFPWVYLPGREREKTQ
ncbi:glycoside hydrolase family 127 protein [Chloroflexota bacterium]|nr:glycoside hydrolase family 127 protein [Chloroflexota bacterium]